MRNVSRQIADLEAQLALLRGAPVRIAKAVPGPKPTSDGFPSGTGGCDCAHCIEGVTMPASSTVCCESHLRWEFVDPVFGDSRTLKWSTGNVWLTDEFDGQTCEVDAADESACTGLGGTWNDPVCTINPGNAYKWQLTVSATIGETVLELVLVTDNGCPEVCAKYVTTKPWQCKCDNALDMKAFGDVSRSTIACRVCLKPDPITICDICSPHTVVHWKATVDSTVYTTSASLSQTHPDDCPWIFTTGSIPCIGHTECLWSVTSGGVSMTVLAYRCQGDIGSSCLNCGLRVWFTDTGGGSVLAVYAGTTADCCYDLDDTFTLDCIQLAFGGDCNPYPNTISLQRMPGLGSLDPNGDGSCDGCSTSAAPTDDAGACCIDGTCFDMSETDCTFFSGVWHSDDDACETTCVETAACCIETLDTPGSRRCIETTADYCTLGGPLSALFAAYFPGLTCDEVVDCDDFGACCDEVTGDCAVTSAGGCVSPLVWHEDETCADITCEPAGSEGCCTGCVSCTPFCATMTESDCTSDGGTGWSADQVCDSGFNCVTPP